MERQLADGDAVSPSATPGSPAHLSSMQSVCAGLRGAAGRDHRRGALTITRWPPARPGRNRSLPVTAGLAAGMRRRTPRSPQSLTSNQHSTPRPNGKRTRAALPPSTVIPVRDVVEAVSPTAETPSRTAAPCAFSLTTRITQRDGRQGTDAPGSRTRVPGPGRKPEPGRWMSPGWRPSPRSPAVSGHPAGSPAVRSPSSSLGGIKASRPALLLTPARNPLPASPSE